MTWLIALCRSAQGGGQNIWGRKRLSVLVLPETDEGPTSFVTTDKARERAEHLHLQPVFWENEEV